MKTYDKEINLGETPEGNAVVFDLFKFLETRLLVQASSGGGKSYLLRRIIEQVLKSEIPVWVIDPEGEYSTLREKFDLVILAADGDLGLENLETVLPALLKKGISCVFDLSDLNLEEKRECVVKICTAILALGKEDWKSLLLCIDEAQIFAPEGKSSASIEAVSDLASRIRKRGVGLVVATQRLSALDKNLTSHLHNRIIGYCLEDIEVLRAANYVGKQESKKLQQFMPGDFYALGAALNYRIPTQFHAGAVETTHPDPSTRRTLHAPKATLELENILAELREAIADEKKMEETEDPEKTRNNISDNFQLDERSRRLDVRENDLIERERALEAIEAQIYQKLETVFLEANLLIETSFEATKRDLGRVFKLSENGQAKLDMYKQNLPAIENTVFAEKQDEQVKREAENFRPVPRKPEKPFLKLKSDFLSRPQRKILDTLATFEQLGLTELDKANVAVISGASPKSSAFTANLSFLRNAGKQGRHPSLIEYSGGNIKLTAEGRNYARPSVNITSLTELHNAWCNHLTGKQSAMIRHLLAFRRGQRIPRTYLAQDTNQSETSSAWTANLSALRKFGLIEYDEENDVKCVYLTNLLFPNI